MSTPINQLPAGVSVGWDGSTQFAEKAPVVLVSPLGIRKPYGTSAADAAGVGAAMVAAQTAASAGDLICVYADASLATMLGKDGVDWWFAPGVTITNTSVDVFGDNGAAMTFTIGGGANFVATGTLARIGNFTAASTIAAQFHSGNATGVGWRNSGAALVLQFDEMTSIDGTFDQLSGSIFARGRRAVSQNYVVEIDGGDSHFNIDVIESTANIPVEYVSGTNGYLRACRIIAPTGTACIESSDTTLTVEGAILETDAAAAVVGDAPTLVNVTRTGDGSIAGAPLPTAGGRAVLHADTTAVGNVGAGEDNLMSYSIPAGALAVDGDSLLFEAIFAATITDDCDWKMFVGGTLVGTWTIGSTGAVTREVIAGTITRISSTQAVVFFQSHKANYRSTIELTGLNFAAAILIQFTGEAYNAADDDIQQLALMIEKRRSQ